MKTWVARIGRVTAWMIVLATAAALTVAVVVPRLGGGTPYTILTGSMQPKLPPGTLVVSKPADFNSIGIGDVVTYQLESGKAAVVTHRVVAISSSAKGERTLRTQGDANNVADEKPVREVQVRGKVWYSVPYLGRVNNLLTGHQRQLGVYAAAAALLGYACVMWYGGIQDTRRRKSLVGQENSTSDIPETDELTTNGS